MECFDDEMLARMREGRLPPEEAARLAEHASGCARCSERLEEADGRRTLVERHTQVIETGNPTGSLERTGREEVPELGRGTPLDRYVVSDVLGKGGMGAVYAAYDSVLDRKVALKLLPPGEDEGPGEVSAGRARLLREAQAMARLNNHPNVVSVYDVYQHGAQVFIAMELVDGQTLKQWLREKPRSWREVLSAFLAAGRGLAAAHAVGLIHRDFKPTNVLVGRDGRVRVTDFGLARERTAPSPEPSSPPGPPRSAPGPVFASPLAPHSLLELELTQKGAVMGTPAYMSPEQHLGGLADARSDQFSFAVALWEALYGELPFEGDSSPTRRDNVLAGRLRPPPAHAKVPPWVHRALLRALRVPPEERYPSLDALLAVLERNPAQVRRRRLATAATLLLVAGSGLLAYSGWQQRTALLCTGAPERLEGIWDGSRRQSIQKAFLATGQPYARDTWGRVQDSLSVYTEAWVEMHRETCQATRILGEQSESVMSLRMACLEGRRQELAALTEVFSEADGTVVEKAVSAAGSLRPLQGCADVELLLAEVKPPRDAATRQAVEAARARLARVRALAEAGRLKQALELAASTTREASTLGYKPIHAEALFQQALAKILSGESQGVPALLQEALWLAHASRHDTVAAAASVRLMGYYSLRGPQEEAERWGLFAEAALERLGDEGELRATFLNNRGMALYQRGNFPEAYESFDKAFALAQEHLGPAHSMTLRYASNALAALSNLDRVDETLRAQKALIRMAETTLGPHHPSLSLPLMNLAASYSDQGRLEEARLALDRVYEIGQQAYGPHSEKWASYHAARGNLEFAQAHDAEALRHHEEALRLYLQLEGPEGPRTLMSRLSIVRVQFMLERVSEAQRTLQQVLELTKKEPRKYEQVYTSALLHLANIHDTQGDHDKALRLRQQALELREQQWGPEHINTALTRLSIANSHIELAQPERALALVEQVLPVFEKMQDDESPTGTLPLAIKGEALLPLGRADEALPLLEHVLQVLERRPERPEYTAEVHLLLARALWETGKDGARPLRLATAARGVLSRRPLLYKKELAELEALLERYAPSSPAPSAPSATLPTP